MTGEDEVGRFLKNDWKAFADAAKLAPIHWSDASRASNISNILVLLLLTTSSCQFYDIVKSWQAADCLALLYIYPGELHSCRSSDTTESNGVNV